MRMPKIINALFAKESDMNQDTLTAAEIRNACPGMPDAVVRDYVSRQWRNVESVQRNYGAMLIKEREQVRSAIDREKQKRAATEQRIGDLEKELASHRPSRRNPTGRVSAPPGVEPLAWRPDRNESDSLMSEWRRLVQEKVSNGVPRSNAMAAVARENPELRSELIREFNR